MTKENPDNPHGRQTQRALTGRDAKFPEEYRDRTADDEISLIDLWLVLLRRSPRVRGRDTQTAL
ncbi:hypothetical protein [Halorhodospira halochloris]|uniref:hypothetical protein n=1 Tax=Halorhodospira halochloris TaxID=1052 RepID=UPI00076F8EBC|nr:hypothetical protein [Halorhodospira halochloris]MBK1651362.1 hypothetical protein [Halorhodospira halochloris]